MKLRTKKGFLYGCIIITALFCSAGSGRSAGKYEAEVRRGRCVEILCDALKNNADWETRVRAADALLWNVYADSVKAYFNVSGKLPDGEGVDILRIQALMHKKEAAVYNEYINKLIAISFDTESPHRVKAVKNLALLGYSGRLPEIIDCAEHGEEELQTACRWILANSGGDEDILLLAGLLDSPDSSAVFLAAAALRSLVSVGDDAIGKLEECRSRLTAGNQRNVFVTSAVYVHSTGESADEIKNEMYAYAAGRTQERMEVCEALAIRGELSDIPLLEELLNDPEKPVQVRAANALLRIERREFRGLLRVDWIVIVFYIILMLAIGLYYFRRQKTSEEYLVGNRHVNSVASGISLFASFMSTITYLAVAGETIKHGPLVMLVYLFCFPVIYFSAAYFLIPFFMKIRITSAYEIIEKPLGKSVRITGSIIFLLTRFVWMALLIFLTAKTLVVMLNWNETYIMHIAILCGIITVIYATMGGLRAVVVTDVTQFIILMLGALLTLVLVTVQLGGVGAWMPVEWAPNWDKVVVFSLDPYVRLTIVFIALNRIAYWICTAGSDQMAIQRFVATKNIKAARRSFLTAQSVETVLFCVLMCVGFAILSYYRVNPYLVPDGKSLIADADFLFPNFIANSLPVGISGLLVAALFSAAMSSLSSGINSTAAVITADIIPWITKNNQNSRSSLTLAKWSSLAVGILVVAISSRMGDVPGNIMEVTAKTSNFFVAPLFNLFFMAFFISFATPFGTIMGAVYGIAAAFILSFWDVMTGFPPVTFLWIIPGSLFVSIAASILFSLIPTKGKNVFTIVLWSCALIVPVVFIIISLWLR